MFDAIHTALHTLGNGAKELTGIESNSQKDAH